MESIYLDNIAGTKPDERVVEAVMPYLTEKYGNPAAHFYPLGRESYLALNNARKQVAELINAKNLEDIIFTSNGTESNNIAIKGVLGLSGNKKHIIISEIEHYSIQNPVLKLTNEGYTFTKLQVDKGGRISPESVLKAIKEDTAMVAIAHANSEIGVIQDIEAIGKICKEKGIHFHVDAVASCGFVEIDVEKMNASTLTIAAQNFYGIRGAAVLYVAPNVKLKPLFDGGFQEKGIRSGSENVPAIIGLGKACEILLEKQDSEILHIKRLRDTFEKRVLEEIPDTYVNGAIDNRVPSISDIAFRYIEGEALMVYAREVCCSAGSACTSASTNPSHVLSAINIDEVDIHGALRFSFGRFNTLDEVNRAVDVLKESVEKLRKMSPLYNK